MIRRALTGTVLLLCSVSLAFGCGTERWAVKVGTDQDAARVDLTPIQSSISHLISLDGPDHVSGHSKSRFPEEFDTYQVSGILTLIRSEDGRDGDGDYHIVIANRNDHSKTMIVESPDPGCATRSAFKQQIEDVREAIDQHFGGAIHGTEKPNIPVTVMGVLFWDKKHGQTGIAPNGVELHPILEIKF